jgi:hypothetical protein
MTSASYIEVHVDEIAQLFHTLDPFPFRERDLDQNVEDYIVSWARETLQDISEAFNRYFDSRAVAIQHELNELFRIGRRALGIGIVILMACLGAAHFADGHLTGLPLKNLVRESFLILGWVANWRPLEIFLYEWWPIVRRRDLYRRLAVAPVDLQPYSSRTQEPISSSSPS